LFVFVVVVVIVVGGYQMSEVIGVSTTPINSKIYVSGCLFIMLDLVVAWRLIVIIV